MLLSLNAIAVDIDTGSIDSIIDHKLSASGSGTIRDYIKSLSAKSGSGAPEWYVIALSRYIDGINFDAYTEALEAYIKNNPGIKATDEQRIALAFSAADFETDYIGEVIENSTGKLGIMSYIYSLILLDSRGLTSEKIKRDDIINSILDSFIPAGGWALSGETPDVDITAMALTALSPYYSHDDVKQVVDTALEWMSGRQKENGGFSSWGTENCESTAQVLVALCSLDIDYTTDERFIKNGHTVIDGMLLYRNADGGFSHIIGGKSNEIATYQALMALISVYRFESSMTPLYNFGGIPVDRFDNIISETSNSSGESEAVISETENDSAASLSYGENIKTGNDYKLWIYIIIGSISFTAMLVLLILKKLKKVNLLLIILSAVILAVIVFFLNIQTPEEFYLVHIDDISPEDETVFISISCGVIKNEQDGGTILVSTEYVLRPEDTAFDLLLRTVRHNRIQMEYSGINTKGYGTVYIEGIDNIYEFDHGMTSGWMYRVNGEFMSTGCSNYELKGGDVVEWVYTLDFGNDIE